MSENIYRLDLTEREQVDLLDALEVWMEANDGDTYTRLWSLYQKVGNLEPIGTGGTTEGA